VIRLRASFEHGSSMVRWGVFALPTPIEGGSANMVRAPFPHRGIGASSGASCWKVLQHRRAAVAAAPPSQLRSPEKVNQGDK
jgi:hypothetical protein